MYLDFVQSIESKVQSLNEYTPENAWKPQAHMRVPQTRVLDPLQGP